MKLLLSHRTLLFLHYNNFSRTFNVVAVARGKSRSEEVCYYMLNDHYFFLTELSRSHFRLQPSPTALTPAHREIYRGPSAISIPQIHLHPEPLLREDIDFMLDPRLIWSICWLCMSLSRCLEPFVLVRYCLLMWTSSLSTQTTVYPLAYITDFDLVRSTSHMIAIGSLVSVFYKLCYA